MKRLYQPLPGFSRHAEPFRLPASLSPVLFKYRWHASFHLVFSRPLFLFLVYPFSTLSSQPSILFKSRWLVYVHLVVGCPLFLVHDVSVLNTFLSMCSSSVLITCPYQFNRFSVTFGSLRHSHCSSDMFVPACMVPCLRVFACHTSILAFSSRSSQSFFFLLYVAHVAGQVTDL